MYVYSRVHATCIKRLYFYLKTLLDNFHILTMTFSKWTENKTLPPDFLEGEMRKEDKTAC